MVSVIFKLKAVITSWKKKAIQTTWSDNDDSSSDDEDTVGRLVVHDKKLKLEDSDDEISKSCDIYLSRELHILPHDNVRTSSVKSTDKESNSKAESSHDVNSILELWVKYTITCIQSG